MTESAQTTTETLLGALRANRHAAADLEVERLELTVDWAVENTVTADGEWAAHQVSLFGDRALPIAGPGAPLVSEFALMEYAAALGMSTDSGKAYVGKTLELRYRLPAAVGAGLERPVAGVAGDARGRADRLPAHGGGRRGRPGTRARPPGRAPGPRSAASSRRPWPATTPTEAEDRRRRAADARRFDVETDLVDTAGTVQVHGCLDLADALDLEAAVSRTATQLAELGSTESLDVRRSMAVGEIARQQLALDLETGEIQTGRGRAVVLNVHLTEAAIAGVGGNVARCGNTRTPVLLDQVRDWCQNAGQITIVPIKDLAAHHHVEAYEIPDRIKQQTELLNHTCVFPHCTRRAERCDHDHIDPHQPDGTGGATCSHNIAPLCRRHHRAKTHGRWRYHRLHPTGYEWTTPHGYRILRDHYGTHPAVPPDRPFDCAPGET